MKKFIFSILMAWEEWVFKLDEPVLVGMAKLVFSIAVPIFLLIGIVGVLDPNCDHHEILNTTQTWSCVASHQEWEKVYHGKISRWEWVTECDRYERKPGHEHDWSGQ